MQSLNAWWRDAFQKKLWNFHLLFTNVFSTSSSVVTPMISFACVRLSSVYIPSESCMFSEGDPNTLSIWRQFSLVLLTAGEMEKQWQIWAKNSGLHILRRSNNSKLRKSWDVRTLDTISSFSNLEIASSTSKSHFSLNLVASSCSQWRSRSCFTEVKSVNTQQISPASKVPSPRAKKA